MSLPSLSPLILLGLIAKRTPYAISSADMKTMPKWHDFQTIRSCDFLRSEPRFQAILPKMGLPAK